MELDKEFVIRWFALAFIVKSIRGLQIFMWHAIT